jgi:hypothetical protein
VVGFYAPVVFLGSALRHLDGEPARLGRSVTVTVALRLGRTGSFSLLFFLAPQPRQRRGNRHGNLSLLFISCRGDDWIRDIFIRDGDRWLVRVSPVPPPPPTPPPHDLEREPEERGGLVALFDPEPGGAFDPAKFRQLCLLAVADYVSARVMTDEGAALRSVVFSNGRRSATRAATFSNCVP